MRRFLLKLFRRRNLQNDLETELAFHREMAAAQGNPIGLGNTSVLKEQALDLWRFNFPENLWRDLTYATRGLLRSPGFVLSAVLSLALGIGVNATMFSLTVEFLFSQPSVSDPQSMVTLQVGGNSHAERKIRTMVEESGIFTDVIGENVESSVNWNSGSDTRPISSVLTSKNYFAVLNVPMAVGRGWTKDDPDEVAVLGYPFWQKHFNGDPSVIGRAVNLNGRMHMIVGVLPENHRTLFGFGVSPEVYLPSDQDGTYLMLFARLKPGMSLGEAKAAMLTVTERLPGLYPDRWKKNPGCAIASVDGIARLQQDGQLTAVSLFFVMLMVITGLVLLIACVNVANLLLARASARRQEIGIRLSLGASRGRLLQQLMAESCLLALLGTVLGLFLAYATAKSLAAIPLPLPIPIRLRIEPDWRVFLFAAVLAVIATIVSGLLPALQSVRESIQTSLRRDRKIRMRRILVTGQIAISVVVLTTGFLFLRNLLLSSAISPGFDVHHTLRAAVHFPPAAKTEPLRISVFVDQALQKLQAIPGVEAVAASRVIPFNGNVVYGTEMTFPDSGETRKSRFNWNAVTPDYFKAMSIPIYEGRPFVLSDAHGPNVVLVNRTFAQRYLQGRRATGTVMVWHLENEKKPFTIIGVVGDTKNISIGEDDRALLYQPLSQIDNNRPATQFVVRSKLPPTVQVEPVRAALRQLEPEAGLEVATMYSSIGLAFLPSQIGAVLLGSIGLLGLILAVVGLYGVMAYSVARRTREIGVRIAVGATSRDVSRMVFGDSARLILIGLAIGLAIAFFVTKPLTMFLIPGLSPSDPLTYFVVMLVLTGAGLIATLGPVQRALAVDPAASLRYE